MFSVVTKNNSNVECRDRYKISTSTHLEKQMDRVWEKRVFKGDCDNVYVPLNNSRTENGFDVHYTITKAACISIVRVCELRTISSLKNFPIVD